LGIFFSWRAIFIDAGHQRGTSYNRKSNMKKIIFLKMFTKIVVKFFLAFLNGTNKSIANFRETLPLKDVTVT
jgi:hypothetical protein